MVDVEYCQPPTYKKGPNKPKLRFREHDEIGSRRRRYGVAYKNM